MNTFTLEWLQQATLAEFKQKAGRIAPGSQELADLNALLISPEGRKIAYEMVNDPDYIPVSKRVPTPEEAEQIAVDQALADQQAVEAAAQVAAQAIVSPPSPPEERKKIVVDYQATDEEGRPIGRPTHIEGWSWEEVSQKQRDAHINAVRYAERVKNNRFKQSAAALQSVEQTAVARQLHEESEKLTAEAVNEKDPAKLQEAVKKSVQAEREAKIAEDAAKAHARIVADTWMEDHKEDFAPIMANSNIIGEWLQKQNPPLAFTYENLERAYEACKNQIVKPERRAISEPVPVTPVANPPAVATVAPAATAPPIAAPEAEVPVTPSIPAVPASSQPVPTAPAPTPAVAAQSAPPARRPGVNGSLPPGAMSAARPAAQQQPTTTTRAELVKAAKAMSPEQFRKKLRDPNYVKQLDAAGIPYR